MRTKRIFFYFIFLIFAMLLILFISNVYLRFLANKNMNNLISLVQEKNSIFSIEKIVFFSNANSNSKINENTSITISDLYQYTDIAIFIENNSEQDFYMGNTLKQVWIENITFPTTPAIGNYNLYYQNLNNFASGNFQEDKILGNSLNFEVTSLDEIDYSSPVLYNNCANPITLSFVNKNIVSDYTLPQEENVIQYNGSLLKKCNIPISYLNCKISFDIYITNNLNDTYKGKVFFDIPLSDEMSSIYDGFYQKELVTDFKFYKQRLLVFVHKTTAINLIIIEDFELLSVHTFEF